MNERTRDERFSPLFVILIIKWRRILRINWRSRERARQSGRVAGARWASVFPSGNHGVRLFVGDEGCRTYWWVAAHRSFDGRPGRLPPPRMERHPGVAVACHSHGAEAGLRQIPNKELRHLIIKIVTVPGS